MSKNRAETTRKWDSYATEAAVPDFVIEVSDGDPIRITNPTGVQLMRLAQGVRAGDDLAVLLALTGDAHDRIQVLLGKTGHGAVPALVEDLMDHFDVYDDVDLIGPSGGKVTERRPSKINALLRMGYKPAQGE